MTKAEFVDRVAENSGLRKGEASKAVDAVLDSIQEVLARTVERSTSPASGSSRWRTAAPARESTRRPARRSRSLRAGCRALDRVGLGRGQGRLAQSTRAPGLSGASIEGQLADPGASSPHFADRLAALVHERRSRVVLGLDPDPALWPAAVERLAEFRRASSRSDRTAEAVHEHCRAAIVAAGPACVAVKAQLACFERPRAPAGRRSGR